MTLHAIPDSRSQGGLVLIKSGNAGTGIKWKPGHSSILLVGDICLKESGMVSLYWRSFGIALKVRRIPRGWRDTSKVLSSDTLLSTF